MTTKKQYQQLRERIIEAVPEIVELKFGCKVKEKPAFGSAFKNQTWNGRKLFMAIMQDRTEAWLFATDGGFVSVKEDELINWHKILGREIRLADILIAIEKKYTGWTWSVNCNGGFSKKDVTWIMCEWNLHHNSLSWHYKNKPQTISFLYDLLVPKK